MNNRLIETRFTVPVLTALIIGACNGSGGVFVGGDLAGIGGSGFISSGTVTGFGSVFVNGVEYETNQSTINIEGIQGSQQDLRIGMVVQVSGSVNADGITGTANSIQYSNEIQGPVDNLQVLSATEKSFTIMGQTVIVTQADTAYEGVSFTSIAPGNVVEVSGFYDQNGALQASYLELQSATFDALSEVEVKGAISNLSGSQFTVQGITIDASSVSVLEGFTNGFQDGLRVEIKGTFDVASNALVATKIEVEDDLLDSVDEAEVEGYITRFVSNSDFDVNGIPVDSSNISTGSLQLSLGIKVEVEGSIVNGVLVAESIELRGGNAEVSAKVDTVNVQSNSFTMAVVAGQPSVTVQLSSITRMEDDASGSDDNLLLSELQPGIDFVSVLGFEEGTSAITATRVKREAEIRNTELQGKVSAKSNNSVTVLGVTFTIDGTTQIEDNNEISIDINTFLNELILDQTVISIEDKAENGGPDGVADTIELEN